MRAGLKMMAKITIAIGHSRACFLQFCDFITSAMTNSPGKCANQQRAPDTGFSPKNFSLPTGAFKDSPALAKGKFFYPTRRFFDQKP